MAEDATYPSVLQRRQDGNAHVPTGKSLTIESGGTLATESGATVTQAATQTVTGEVDLTGGTSRQPQTPFKTQGDPTAKTTAVTLTIAELLTGIITGTHAAGATQAYTLPTGTLSDAGLPSTVGADEGFEWTLINLSAAALDTITVTAGTGHTIVGNPIVQSAHATTGGIYGNSSRWFTRKTAANTMVSYRMA